MTTVGTELDTLLGDQGTRAVHRVVIGVPIVIACAGAFGAAGFGAGAGLLAVAAILGWTQLAGA